MRDGQTVKRHPVATVNVRGNTRYYVDSCTSHSGCRVPIAFSQICDGQRRPRATSIARATVSCPRGKTSVDAVGHQVCCVHATGRRDTTWTCTRTGQSVAARHFRVAGQDVRESRARVSGSELHPVNCLWRDGRVHGAGRRDSVCLCGLTIRGPSSLDDPIALHVRNVFGFHHLCSPVSTTRGESVTLRTGPSRLFRRQEPGRRSRIRIYTYRSRQNRGDVYLSPTSRAGLRRKCRAGL